MNNMTTKLTRIEDLPKVVKAKQQVLKARKDQDIVTKDYQHARNLVSGLSSAARGEQQQATVDLPELKRKHCQAQLNVQAAEDALTQAKERANADRTPVLKEELKALVSERNAKAEDLVHTNDAILNVWEEANHVFGGSQQEIPNLVWPEFREDGMLSFRRNQYQQEGWLST